MLLVTSLSTYLLGFVLLMLTVALAQSPGGNADATPSSPSTPGNDPNPDQPMAIDDSCQTEMSAPDIDRLQEGLLETNGEIYKLR